MSKYIYLVHSEVNEYICCDLINTETHKLAFASEDKAIKYIEDEMELFTKENTETNISVSKELGYFGAMYNDEKKIIMIKMWYERVAIVE